MTRPSTRIVDAGCRAQLEKIFAYIDGTLSPARVRAIELHLDRCACCAALQEDLRRTVAACRSAGHLRLPAPIRRRAKARIRRLLDTS